MPCKTAKSFAEVAFIEAVARRTRVDLTAQLPGPEGASQLCSRFLGFAAEAPGAVRSRGHAPDPDGLLRPLVIDMPELAGRRVFLPRGLALGMTFRLGRFAMRAQTTVVDHCQFRVHPLRRIDAVLLGLPHTLESVDQRQSPRRDIDPSIQAIAAAVWRADELAGGGPARPKLGQVCNRSARGLGVRFPDRLTWPGGTTVVLRLEERGRDERRIFQGVLRHCTPLKDGCWMAGFDAVAEMGPGEAVGLSEALADAPG